MNPQKQTFEKLNHDIKIRLTSEEFEKVKSKAEEFFDMSLNAFCRLAIKNFCDTAKLELIKK